MNWSIDPETGYDLWAVPLEKDGKPFPIAQSAFTEIAGKFSPDGKWVAYQSNESGRFEIYIQSFPDGRNKTQISANGGAQVHWRHDGKELFYVALDGQLMSIPMNLGSSPPVEEAAPVPLFATHIGGAVQGDNRQQYTVSPDGQRFLLNTVTQEAPPPPIVLLLNWKPKR